MIPEQSIDTADWWTIELDTKPDFEMSMKRVYAWHQQEIIDRAPVRFVAHNEAFNVASTHNKSPEEWKQIWFDVEPRIDQFEKSLEGKNFLGETFPMFDPNLGPDIYAAFYGTELYYGEVTSWSHPMVEKWDDMEKLKLDMGGLYFKKIEELMTSALERCAGKYLVGYTDLHPGEDCAMAWRGSQRMCMDLYDSPAEVKQLIDIAFADFQMIFDHFNAILKAHRQPSMCWIGIPSFGKFHVPSCDFSAMISPSSFAEFSMPILRQEVKGMTHNVYHVDGKGVANHLDQILSLPEINGIQWVQDPHKQAIMQWVPLVKKVLTAGKSIIVDLRHSELEDFIAAMDSPKGIYFWISTNDEEEQRAIINRLEKWA